MAARRKSVSVPARPVGAGIAVAGMRMRPPARSWRLIVRLVRHGSTVSDCQERQLLRESGANTWDRPEVARLITTGEAARELGVSRETLNAWVRDGKVTPHSRTVGNHMRWDLEQLRRQIRDAQEATPVSDPTKPEQQPVVM